jgi:NTP pyrophosphatase (non-canonical NTP hydrolase)
MDVNTRAVAEVVSEADSAASIYGPFTSTHEAYGVLAEEVAELLDAINKNNRHDIAQEARQVSAVSLRLFAQASELLDDDEYSNDFSKRSSL